MSSSGRPVPAQSGSGLPDGGTTGQALVKASGDDGDGEWIDAPALPLSVCALTHNGDDWVNADGDVFDARPVGYAVVIWIGPDPGVLSTDYDLWVLTS